MSAQTPHTPRKGRRVARYLGRAAALACLIATIVLGAVAAGYFTSRATGITTARVGSVGAPTNVTAEQTGAAVRISWDAASAGSGDGVDGYRVTRSDGSPICGETAPVAALSCTDAAVPGGEVTYTVTAVYRSLTASATTAAIVLRRPTITLSPAIGHVDDTMTVGGADFPADTAITATFAQAPITVAPAAASTDAAGGIPDGVTLTVPSDTAGAHTVHIAAGAGSADATFTIAPRISVSPQNGARDAVATVTGVGFAAHSTVTATFGGAPLALSTDETDASGALSASYTVPDESAGSHEVFVGDAAGNIASATYTIDAPSSLRLSSTAGHVTDTVTLGGADFGAASAITATYDGAPLPLSGPSTTDGLGALPGGITFVVPPSTAGDHTVDVTAGGHSASATYTVNPQAILSTATGVAGSSVSIAGTGFAAASPITAQLATKDMMLTGTTTSDAAGSFAGATFRVPSAPGGDYPVSVSDAATPAPDTAASVFTITPAIIVTPSSGVVGTTATIAGTGFSAGEDITAAFDSSPLPLGDQTTTDADGAFPAVTFVVPSIAAGSHTVSASDASKHSAAAEFAVGGTLAGLAPTTGTVGSSADVTVEHFAASSPLSVAVGGVPATILSGGSTDADGHANVSFTIPAVPGGSRSVTVSDAAGDSGASPGEFTVTPQITLAPDNGEVGATATISGTGFAALATLTATFGGAEVTLSPHTSDASGSFTAVYTVPSAPAGPLSVVVTDAAGDAMSADFTITDPFDGVGPVGGPAAVAASSRTDTARTGAFAARSVTPKTRSSLEPILARRAGRTISVPRVKLLPTTAPSRAIVVLSGSHFPARSRITASWDGAALALTGDTRTTRRGEVPDGVSFCVPASAAAGRHTVIVTGGGETAEAVFTVTITARGGVVRDAGGAGTTSPTVSSAGEPAPPGAATLPTDISFPAGVGTAHAPPATEQQPIATEQQPTATEQQPPGTEQQPPQGAQASPAP